MDDCVIVGGGPAGLSAAIYMGRFMRSTLVIDMEEGRSSYRQINENYLGFPDGISVRDLHMLGRKQAERFGAHFKRAYADTLEQIPGGFKLSTSLGQLEAKTVILCTGVTDRWPTIPNVEQYVGRTLFWCITCDGHRAVGKRLLLFGEGDEAATTACQFRMFTDKITFIAPPGHVDCSDQKIRDLGALGIPVVEGEIASVEGAAAAIHGVKLKDGRDLEGDMIFSLYPPRPNNKLALDIGAKVSPDGFVVVDEEGYTSVPGFFAAGDISRMHSHQVVSAAAEGAEAAQTANYYLYAGYQRNPGDCKPFMEPAKIAAEMR